MQLRHSNNEELPFDLFEVLIVVGGINGAVSAATPAGHVDEATSYALDAVSFARRHQHRGWGAWALRLQGEIASPSDVRNVKMAESHDAAAIVLAAERSMRPLVAHCAPGLSKLYWHAGERESAREHFGSAMTMCHEMDMQRWLERAAAEVN